MLCKRTMRAALAPVIGLFGVAVAFTAGAAVYLGDAPDGASSETQHYAAETVSTEGCLSVLGTCLGYRIVASGTEMDISTETDVLLPQDHHYVRYDFDGAFFARDLVGADLQFVNVGETEGPDTAAFAVAFEGTQGDSKVIFDVNGGGANGKRYERGSTITLGLGGTATVDQPGIAEIYVTRTGSITATVSVYSSLPDALGGTGALYQANGTVAQLDKVVGGKITSMADTADVSTSVEDGGPFRRFVPGGMGGKNSGVLGMTNISVNKGSSTSPYRNAMTGETVADDIVASLRVRVTAVAGDFVVATKEGGAIPTNRNPWRLAKEAECESGPLSLGVLGSTIATYQSEACPFGSADDCNGDPDGDGPLLKGDLTPEGIKSANTATGTAGQAIGDNYFCVRAVGNTDPIPEIGDPSAPAQYNLAITPILADAVNHPFKPDEIAEAVGAIDRNGTTVHVTYLTTNPFVDQRLVLVNRGADAVAFWIEGDSFNLEDGTTVETNNLAVEMGQMIPGNGRLVVKVTDNITFDGETRGAATVNVAAPTRDIDVMTIQRSPFTDDVDTTVYQHADN